MKKAIMAAGIIMISLCFAGTVFADCEYYEAYGDHSWIQTDFISPTCETEGGYTNVCEYCGVSYFNDLPSTHHDWHWVVVEDSTCTEEGLGAAECWNCGERNYEPIQPVDHVWVTAGTIRQATCVQEGIVQERCANCGETREYTTGIGSHTYGGWTVSKAAGENTQGTRTRSCTQCGASYSESFYPEGTVMRGGSNNTALVKELQQMLVDLNYLNDTVDGAFGGNTEAAVKAFQTDHQLNADGIGWPQTISAVRRAANGGTGSGLSGADFYEDGKVYTLEQLREIAAQQDCRCAVAYLGEYEAEYKDLAVYLEVADVSTAFPFLTEIPEEQFITYEGTQLFCIVPADEQAALTVNQWFFSENSNESGKAGETIYDRDSGDPIYVRGNADDLMPNLQVLVVDQDERSTEFYPWIDSENHELEMPNGGGVLDFTPYGSKLLDS